MHVLFDNGGKQYLVSKGDIINVEKINKLIGTTIEVDNILMYCKNNIYKFGNPYIKNICVIAKIINHNRSKKIKIIKFIRRKHYRRNYGHRQWFTQIKIIDIIL
ncbi:MAG: 50S ribosomal protein L21 [Candidatus Lightella neohaematopini]|nr:50S ribosomal protein L21 [Candidatus Lightella neohaematopini]MCV2531128.1 50S ribosomal protein L21 [Candidatus Lightella neohaematopini]